MPRVARIGDTTLDDDGDVGNITSGCECVFACGRGGGGASVDETLPYSGGEPGTSGNLPAPDGTYISEADVDIYDLNQDDPEDSSADTATVPGQVAKRNVVEEENDQTTPSVSTPVSGCNYPSGFNWSTFYGSPAPPNFDTWASSPGTYPEAQLSTNYTVADLTINTAVSTYRFTTATSQNGGYSQEFILENLCYHATELLEPLLADGSVPTFTITSAYRNKARTSQHAQGQATDIQIMSYHGLSNTGELYFNLAQYIRDNFNFDQLILEWFGRNPWIHISTDSGLNRGNVLTQTGANTYSPGLIRLTT